MSLVEHYTGYNWIKVKHTNAIEIMLPNNIILKKLIFLSKKYEN